jgi:phage RecT family recombinase
VPDTETLLAAIDRLIAIGYFSDREIAAAKYSAALAGQPDAWRPLLVRNDYAARYGRPGEQALDVYMRQHPGARERFERAGRSMNAPTARIDLTRAREQLLDRIEAERSALALYLPEGVPLDRFMRLARDAVLVQPQLAECSADSVLRALAKCAASGLPLDGKFSSLIVRKSKHGRPTASWDPSYRGMVSLALASGLVKDAQGYAVRSADRFEVELGSEPRIVHVPCLLPKCGEVIAAYAVATLASGGRVIEVLTLGDIAKIRAMSPAGDSGPWSTWFDEQSRKSALRRLLKRLPASPARVMMPPTQPQPTATIEAPAQNGALRIALSVDPVRENALLCTSLERLSAAETLADLEAAWAQCVFEHQQGGVELPVRVEAAYRDRREALLQEPAPD